MMRRAFERQPSARHTRGLATLCAALAVVAVVVRAGPASAGSVWDTDDATGRLDIRWLGVTFQADATTRLAVSFYDDFRASALPTLRNSADRDRGEIWVRLTEFESGRFVYRLDGRLMFQYGDFGSTCCETAPVRNPSPNVLRVIFATDFIYEPVRPYEVRAESEWRMHGDVFRDHTASIDLGPPPEP